MKRLRKHIANEKGATIVYVAVAMAAFLSMAALAIDLGMLHDARSEAHRAADAAALAGASTFQTPVAADQVELVAKSAATTYAGMNRVLGASVRPAEVFVEVTPDEGRVRATVRRQGISLWFARIFGVNNSGVAARAAASVVSSGTAECVAPLMIPDAWQDTNRNDAYDALPAPGEYYDMLKTGWGMDYRNEGQPGFPFISNAPDGPYVNDFGRQLLLKVGNAGQGMTAGWYFPARIGDNKGGDDFRTDLGKACPQGKASIGDLVYPEPGVKKGPTAQAMIDRIAPDPDAKWKNGGIVGSKYPLGCSGIDCTGEGSPRIMTVPFFDPRSPLPNGSSSPLPIVNFGAFFIEHITQDGDITGRWVKVRGVPDNCLAKGNCRSYMQALRLVE